MDKKSLKWYDTPAMELINVNVEGQLLAGSNVESDVDGVDVEGPGEVL